MTDVPEQELVAVTWTTTSRHFAYLPAEQLREAARGCLTNDEQLDPAAFTGGVTGDLAALLAKHETSRSDRTVTDRQWLEVQLPSHL